MATSPTQLTLKEMRKRGFKTLQVVESFNFFIKQRKDLFGAWDVLGVFEGVTVAIQTTTKANMSARIRKIEESESLNDLRDANWVLLVHGWYKEKNRWKLKEVDVS